MYGGEETKRRAPRPGAERLIRAGLLGEESLYWEMTERGFRAVADLIERGPLAPELARLIPRKLAEALVVLPLAVDDELIVAAIDPTDRAIASYLQDLSGRPARLCLARRVEILRAIPSAYGLR